MVHQRSARSLAAGSDCPPVLGAFWHKVRPFGMVLTRNSASARPDESDEYAVAYNEVKPLGGGGITTPTTRTQSQTFVAIF